MSRGIIDAKFERGALVLGDGHEREFDSCTLTWESSRKGDFLVEFTYRVAENSLELQVDGDPWLITGIEHFEILHGAGLSDPYFVNWPLRLGSRVLFEKNANNRCECVIGVSSIDEIEIGICQFTGMKRR